MLRKDKTAKARLWVYGGDESHPYNVFDFTLDRSRNGPLRFLQDYHQVLVADASGGYNGMVLSYNKFTKFRLRPWCSGLGSDSGNPRHPGRKKWWAAYCSVASFPIPGTVSELDFSVSVGRSVYQQRFPLPPEYSPKLLLPSRSI